MLLPAHLHDSQVLGDLLDTELIADQGRKRPVYADSAYRAESHEARLAELEMDSHIREKSMVRTIGLARAKSKISMMNLAHNMKRLVQLTPLAAQRGALQVVGPDEVIAPAVA